MLNFLAFMGGGVIMFCTIFVEFNYEGQNQGNNGGIMMYNYGLYHRELVEHFSVLTLGFFHLVILY